MYNEKCVATTAPAAPRSTTEIAQDLFNGAVRLRNLAEHIETRLYGAKPCEAEKGREASCIEDTLTDTYRALEYAYKTLICIDERL